MQIVLMRHGRPDLGDAPFTRLRANQLFEWINFYNAAEVHEDDHPPKKALDISQSFDSAVCSGLYRTVGSAEKLHITNVVSNSLFLEADLPYPNCQTFKLPINYWLFIFRVSWFLGYSKNSESFKDAKFRAGKAANELETLANAESEILLIGHGIMNKLIARVLRAKGWDKVSAVGQRYWNYEVYEK